MILTLTSRESSPSTITLTSPSATLKGSVTRKPSQLLESIDVGTEYPKEAENTSCILSAKISESLLKSNDLGAFTTINWSAWARNKKKIESREKSIILSVLWKILYVYFVYFTLIFKPKTKNKLSDSNIYLIIWCKIAQKCNILALFSSFS